MFGLGQFGRTAIAPFAFALAAPWMLAGCGEAPETTVPVIPVTGTLTYGGEKVVGARVILHPQGHPLPADRIAVGTTKSDGTFAVAIYDEPKGVPAGEYVGTVEYYKPIEGGTGPNVVPKPYDSPETSPIKVSVKDSPVTIPPIEIKK
ncbi:hypothetical protein [Planctomyces sp. SH-PL14]|uniref:hypothetical protein n=1 Tax=Planctomyces sp. SH-PL14 TaxID=1632864 RepID=UPI00078E7ABD|nr:hypothetical protein [Planctomyces sp. SH-PL14]AMV22067.1 hypothetical protein VT03_29460 [Planctomyces sp. SH-PL14]